MSITKTPVINAQLDRIGEATELLALAHAGTIEVMSEKGIQQIVRSGLASKFFSYGDQVSEKWDQDDTHEYDYDQDVVAFLDAVNALGETKPGLWLQSHWGLPGIQFDASEAIWYCAEALPAGTYHFTIGTTWGNHCVAGKMYQFTLAQGLDVGGQIVIGNGTNFYTWGAPDVAPANWKVYTFANAKSVTPVEGPLELTEGSGGTDLGSLSSSTKYGSTGLNNLQRCAYGYNRWSQSAIRQWLNSDQPVGAWWEPQNVYDRPPQQLASLRGFMAGLSADFLAVVQKVQVVTALNTVSDSELGATETTLDYFFLPSLEQEYIVPQLASVEGSYWPYWKERLGLSSPQIQGGDGANANHIRYAIENHTSAQNVTLRSCHRGHANNRWYVNASTGYATYYFSATSAFRPAPACVIC